MNHCTCGAKLKKQVGDYRFRSRQVGEVVIPDATSFICPECHEITVPEETVAAAIAEHRRIIQTCLWRNADNAEEFTRLFASNAEAGRMLGVSRQALHKVPRYRANIYHVVICGKAYFLRASIRTFIECGDGRFLLHREGTTITAGTASVREESTPAPVEVTYEETVNANN